MIILSNSWKRLFKIFFPFLFTVGLFQFIGAEIAGLDITNLSAKGTPYQYFIVNIFNFLGVFLIVWLFRKYVDKESFKGLGFQKIFIKDILLGFVLGFAVMLLGFFMLIILKQITILSFQYNYVNMAYSLGLFILVALAEELFVRGYILNNLMGSVNKYLALFISAFIFALLHAINPNINWLSFFNLFLAGILLGMSYVFTKNLWFPIALHFSWNFFQGTIFGFNVSGIEGYSVIIQEKQFNSVLNGGDFGFEGSVLCVILQLISILLVYILFRKKEDCKDNIKEPKKILN